MKQGCGYDFPFSTEIILKITFFNGNFEVKSSAWCENERTGDNS